MGLNQNSLSIVIPFYNEPENARAVLGIVESYEGSDIEWIMVNNGSTDGITPAILQASTKIKTVSLEANAGFGGGIKSGISFATSNYIAWLPGNLKVHPLAPKFMLDRFVLENHSTSALVLIKALRVGRGLIPQLKTSASSLLVSILGRAKLRDIGGTPTLVSRSCLEFLTDTPNDYSFELAAFYKLLKEGCQEVRIPSVYLPRIFGQTHWQFGLKPELRLLSAQIKYVWIRRKRE